MQITVLSSSKQDLFESQWTFIELAGHARMLHKTICTQRCRLDSASVPDFFIVLAYILKVLKKTFGDTQATVTGIFSLTAVP